MCFLKTICVRQSRYAFFGLSLLLLVGCGTAPELNPATTEEPAQHAAMPVADEKPTADQPAPPPPVNVIQSGDMDGNGKVDQADREAFLARFDEAFGADSGKAAYDPLLDMDGDGLISWPDLQEFVELVD